MKSYFLITCFLVFSHISFAQHKSRINFNKGWKFKLDSVRSYSDPSVNDKNWRNLNLPHDWSIEGSFSKDNPAGTGGGALPGGIGWYRKTFFVPLSQKGNETFIEFDGVYRNSEVFVNGQSVGRRPNGYISFQYDITQQLKFGSNNVIAVKVDNSKQPNSRWYSGSGIYRNVWLTSLDPSHIKHWGTFITTPVIQQGNATVYINTRIKEAYAQLSLVTTIYDAGGKKVGYDSTDVFASELNRKVEIKIQNSGLLINLIYTKQFQN